MKAAAAAVASVLLLPALFIGALVGGSGSGEAAPAIDGATEVPPAMWALYSAAGARFGLPAGLLAAVGKVECDHGRDPSCAVPNAAGAVGPMQFLPATFASWSWAAATGDPSPLDAHDAVYAAAAKLAADGASGDPERALFSYNHSLAYVATVEAWALVYGWAAPSEAVLARAVVLHPNLSLRPEAANDVEAGIVDGRVLALLLVLATQFRLGAVGPFVTGHSYFVAGTDRPSNHAFGRAVDIPVVDGRAVAPGNADAKAAVGRALSLGAGSAPSEVGCPWPISAVDTRTFTEGHDDHLHFGWDGA